MNDTLINMVALTQILICLTATGMVSKLHTFAPNRYMVRWILILLIIGSGWTAIANFEQSDSLYQAVFVFMVALLLLLGWVIWFHCCVLRNAKHYP